MVPMKLRAFVILACLLLAGCETVSSERIGSAYSVTASTWVFGWTPSTSLLIGKAGALCAQGYRKLAERYGEHEDLPGRVVEWRIQCNGEASAPENSR